MSIVVFMVMRAPEDKIVISFISTKFSEVICAEPSKIKKLLLAGDNGMS